MIYWFGRTNLSKDWNFLLCFSGAKSFDFINHEKILFKKIIDDFADTVKLI